MDTSKAKEVALDIKSEYQRIIKQFETDSDEGVKQVVFTIDPEKFAFKSQYSYLYHYPHTVTQLRDRLSLAVKI